MIILVKQEQVSGCGIASLAMVLGRTYQEVLKDWPKRDEESKWTDELGVVQISRSTYHDFDSERDGMTFMCMDAYLAEQGFSVQRKFKHRSWLRQDRDIWPPAPFGPVHLCSVSTSRGHTVVMLESGEVYDPWFGTGRTLADYKDVAAVAAVYKI